MLSPGWSPRAGCADASGFILQQLCGLSGLLSQFVAHFDQFFFKKLPPGFAAPQVLGPLGSPTTSSSVPTAPTQLLGKESGWQGSFFQPRLPVTGHRSETALGLAGCAWVRCVLQSTSLEGGWPCRERPTSRRNAG